MTNNRPDWRDGPAYEGLKGLDATGFAWEFLRRNTVFLAELAELNGLARRRKPSAAQLERFALHWGVRWQPT